MSDEAYAIALEAEHRRRQAAKRSGLRAHTEYAEDPIGWAVNKLAIPEHTLRWSMNAGYESHDWDGSPDPLVALAEGLVNWRGRRNVGCESGTTTGKSFWVGVLVYWFLACHQDARVFTFAPTEKQLRLFMWMEMQKLWPRFNAWFPSATLTDLSIRMRGGIDDSWTAKGYAVGVGAQEMSATSAQGMHAEHMLLVYEETPGIPLPVIVAGENTCTAPHNLRLAIGNPNHQLDVLHQFCTAPRTKYVRISALDHPNVVTGNPSLIPGAVSQESIDERREKYGETSPVYQSRVLGLSPEQASDALIHLKWLRASAERYEARKAAGDIPTLVTGKGVDVANSEHGDRACIVDFADNVVIKIDAFQCPNANQLGRDVVQQARKHNLPGARVGVDAIGVGASTVNTALDEGFVVQRLYSGGKAMVMCERAEDGKLVEWSPDANMFNNLRSQMWWQLREDFRKGLIDVPKDENGLWKELVTPTFEDEGKVTKVMEKDEMRLLLGRSPDLADALVYANWVRKRAVVPAKPQLRQGQSAGYDFVNQRPATKPSADEELAKFLGEDTSSRYSVPARGAW